MSCFLQTTNIKTTKKNLVLYSKLDTNDAKNDSVLLCNINIRVAEKLTFKRFTFK